MGSSVVGDPPASAGDTGDLGSISGLERFPGEGNGNPLQYSCLRDPMDRGAWWATIPRGCKELDMTEHSRATHIACTILNSQNCLIGSIELAHLKDKKTEV